MLKEAVRVILGLAEQGVTVFHNPDYGIMLAGANNDSPLPDMKYMDEVYALHNEIAMVFAIKSIGRNAESFAKSKSILERMIK
jgi:hypothetical protein